MLGQEVAEIVNQNYCAWKHTVSFDASTLSSGIYLYRLQSADKVESRKMTLIK